VKFAEHSHAGLCLIFQAMVRAGIAQNICQPGMVGVFVANVAILT